LATRARQPIPSNRQRSCRSDRSFVGDGLLGGPLEGNDERHVLVAAQLVELAGLLCEGPIAVGHLEAAPGTDEFAGWFVHRETPTSGGWRRHPLRVE